ncbi:T9SS C-terminal target domain-containing protein [Pontibacter diazotrophicus]|uniref:T9SS C-terminal target domain-containing protein n=1 Tax=Pontibacter diazotrophicus TaxID=1400979 RepID=A0A3D8LHD8_9BACT|nr:M4 family metallopeptidase [Pontibacter diazotrophicus]RDV16322.1 T9SS C-terminal target domain-containing protein [Pontibacter diazotrophicus]
MRKFYVLASLLLGGIIFTQEGYSQQKERVKESLENANEAPSFIKFKAGEEKSFRPDQASQVLKSFLKLPAEEELKPVKQETDKEGFLHQRFAQYYKDVRVEYGSYNVHSKNGVVQSINGEIKRIGKLNTKPALAEKAALQKALAFVGAKTYMWQDPGQEAWIKKYENDPKASFKPNGELVIVNNYLALSKEKSDQPVLAWKFNIYAQEPLSRDYIYVDAQTGEVVHKDAIIKHAAASGSAATRYSGTQNITTDSYSGSYRLRDYSRGGGIETYNCKTGTSYNTATDFTDANNSWTAGEFNNTAKDNAALDAHWAAQKTYDYFKSRYNRNSFDNAGTKIRSYVHYDKSYENAFWNGSVMTYGDGGTRFDALTSLDVGAHEIGHAVCSSTANLVYSNESGALNEGLSDIWAAAVEQYAAPTKSIWLIGEDIDKQRPALRSMSDPNAEGQPDTYKGTNWYSGTGDNGGVHTNSGVLNHWFYLLSVGKSGTNDHGAGYSVAGIGITDAAKIVYRMETVYLTANSGYADARTYAIQSAADLFGEGSNHVIQTTNAWHAVGVGGKYGQTAYCASKGNSTTDEWIAGVKVGSFTNTSSAAGYSDFTGKTISLNAGSTYALTLTPGFSGSAYNEYWKIWIDYNKDGDFDDAGELAFDAGKLNTTAVSGNLVVASAASGTTRMRVSMKYNGAQTACETFSYGEVEDYTVSFSAPTACAVPAGLATSNITASTATLSWAAVSGASSYSLRSRVVGTTTWSTSTVTGTSANATGLAAATQYEFQVSSTCASGSSAYSASKTFTTGAASLSYCASKGGNASYEWIDLVEFGGFKNATGNNGGYKDFTSLTATVARGSSSTIYISAGFSSTAYTEYWKVWIDFNQDGDFDDSGELVVSGSSSSSATLSAAINVPSGALLGKTRMRVSMKYNAAQTACESFGYGEVEDYSVNITNTLQGIATSQSVEANTLGSEVSQDVIVYPNPADSYIRVTTLADEAKGRVMSMTGAAVMQFELKHGRNQMDISALPAGIYILEVHDGQKPHQQRFVKQ